MNKNLLLILLGLFAVGSASAQCYTDEHLKHLLETDSLIRLDYENRIEHERPGVIEYRGTGKNKKAVRIIPVVFHIVHEYGSENISREQIMNQLETLNADYNRMNADTVNTRSEFKSIAANMGIEFKLARIAPDGSCTDGIVRYYSPLSDGGDEEVKVFTANKMKWDYQKYLNVWVVKRIQKNWNPPSFVAGYAVFPNATNSTTDGVIIRHDYVGSTGTAASTNKGRVLTHEIGHWLGLYHPFQGGCTTQKQWTDKVDDTPPVKSPSYGCPLGNNTCSNDNPNQLDNVENYMDYADGSCQNMFTNGQKHRVDSFLNLSFRRGSNISASAISQTGVNTNPSCPPIADFHTVNLATIICQGSGNVTFKDFSFNTENYTLEWLFPGGTPSTSTDASPTVSYDSGGRFDVTLVASNAQGADTLVRPNFITVLPSVADEIAPYSQDFESAGFGHNWQIEGKDNKGWVRNTVLGATGSASMECQISSASSTDERYSLTLPPINVSGHGTPLKINFKHAYSRRISTATEVMLITVSEDCGQTWRTVKGLTASNGLASVNGNNPAWKPTQASDWGFLSLDIGKYAASTNLMIRFEVLVRAGNSVFIDDINIAQFGLGLTEVSRLNPFAIVPNPAQNAVRFQLDENWLNARIEVQDMSGRLLLQSELKRLDQQLNTSSLSNGVYIVYLEKAGVRRSEKLVISR